MKIKELRQKKISELHKLLKLNRDDLRSVRFSISSEQEKNVRKMRDIKKNIAKILTILNTKDKSIKDNHKNQTDSVLKNNTNTITNSNQVDLESVKNETKTESIQNNTNNNKNGNAKDK